MAEKPLRVKELRAMSEPDLKTHLETLRRTVWTKRLKLRDGTLQQWHEIPRAKRQLARVLTILKEKERVTG